MAWNLISSIVLHCEEDAFWDAVDVWIQRPNVCSKIISCASVESASRNPSLSPANLDEILKLSGSSIGKNTTRRGSRRNYEVMIRKLFPKNPSIHSTLSEVILKNDFSVVFIPLSEDLTLNHKEIAYKLGFMPDFHNLTLQEERQSQRRYLITLHALGGIRSRTSNTCAPTLQWLTEKLLPSLVKWAESSKKYGKNLPASLSSIPQNEYAPLYQNLKEKYGKKLAAMWQEATDPQKYVFEDIAIATYLILLWKKERKLKKIDKLQSFIDLGCGNGLLVHILNSEGHPGLGVDVRRRKIWDLYPESTKLQESAVDPTSSYQYEYDWLLGNHSDELTPWIPVMAARSGFHVRYWVLPCCFHDFFTKYERCKSTSSQYEDYLTFVEDIGERCGFEVEVDVLRIPSTKRICHVGMFKAQQVEHHDTILQNMQGFIDGRKAVNDQFKARDKLEVVKNCTKMNRTLQNEIVRVIVVELLKTTNYIELPPRRRLPTNYKSPSQSSSGTFEADFSIPPQLDAICDSVLKNPISAHIVSSFSKPVKPSPEEGVGKPICMRTPHRKDVRLWNRGGALLLEQAADLLTGDMRIEMKRECGGLQTLLRNHHQAFEISSGKVRLRDWSSLVMCSRRQRRKGIQKQRIVKKKGCWFFNNHPDGCPRDEEHCPFLHCTDVGE